MRYGILCALLTLLFGFGLGGAFGAFEDNMKGHLAYKANSVLLPVYEGDVDKLEKTTKKAWTYFKRAHLHANGLGTVSLVLILVLALLSVNRLAMTLTALALGLGSLGYSLFWLLSGLRAPALGSTGLAKESLSWLAIPSSGLCLLGLISTTLMVAYTLFLKHPNPSDA